MSATINWPIYSAADGTSINVTSNSVATQIVSDTTWPTVSEDVLIDNPGPNDVYVKAGPANVAATLLSVRVPAGSMQPFRKEGATHLAFICAAGKTQTVVVHVGEGA